jgi:alkylated DNA repair protein (DNA oxidative demethylase)
MLPALTALWSALAQYPHPPEACLINFYGEAAKMGLHQDRDEADFNAPVVSVSLGDSCLFRVGGRKRGDPTRSFRLNSGDVLVLGGAVRLAFHGVDRIYPGTSTLLAAGGRINLTLRRVTRPDAEIARPLQAAKAANESAQEAAHESANDSVNE